MNRPRIFSFFLLVTAMCMTMSLNAQTTVWIVRHAEKDVKNTAGPDPALSLDGQDRAKDLSRLLMPNRVLAVYATSSKLARQTAQPIAYGRGVTVQTYDPSDPAALASSVVRQYKGGGVLIVGDANTVLELVEAFGMKRPIPELGEDDYSYIFTLNIQGNSIQLQTSQYGKLKRVMAPK